MFERAKDAWGRYVSWTDARTLKDRDRVAKLGPVGYTAYNGVYGFTLIAMIAAMFLGFLIFGMLTITTLIAITVFAGIFAVLQYYVLRKAERSGE